jgi:DNA gyrase subunit A
MAIRFEESDVRSMGRPAYGVRGVTLAKNDYVVGVAITPKEHKEGEYRILSVSEHGFGKRTDVEEYRLQTRGGKGVKNMAVTDRIGRVSSIQLVDDTSELMVISQFGKIIRVDTKTIRNAGRATQGVRLLNLEPEDKVAAAVIIPPEELKEDEQGTLLQ